MTHPSIRVIKSSREVVFKIMKTKLFQLLVVVLILSTANTEAVTVKNGSPRDGDMKLDGMIWLPRMIDKAQLSSDGKLAKLGLAYPCPNDKIMLQNLSISADDFKKIVTSSNTDGEVITKLKSR